jgi:hypothetical protein
MKNDYDDDALMEDSSSNLEDLGHQIIECADCHSPLVDIWRVGESERKTDIQAICKDPNCEGTSWKYSVEGEFYIGCTDCSRIVDIEDKEGITFIHAAPQEKGTI